MYKIKVRFITGSEHQYLLAIIPEDRIDAAVAEIISHRAQEPNTVIEEPIDPQYPTVRRWNYESYSGGPCVLSVSPLNTTTHLWLELTGDSAYYL